MNDAPENLPQGTAEGRREGRCRGEERLRPLPDGSFSPGAPDDTPERIRFTHVLGGRALRMNLSTVEYHRTYMP